MRRESRSLLCIVTRSTPGRAFALRFKFKFIRSKLSDADRYSTAERKRTEWSHERPFMRPRARYGTMFISSVNKHTFVCVVLYSFVFLRHSQDNARLRSVKMSRRENNECARKRGTRLFGQLRLKRTKVLNLNYPLSSCIDYCKNRNEIFAAARNREF